MTSTALPRHVKPLGYVVAWSFGFWIDATRDRLVAEGKLKIHGREHAIEAAKRGNGIFAANHVSVDDDWFIASALGPHYRWDDRFFPFSMPDERTIKSACNLKMLGREVDVSKLFAAVFRGIPVNREDPRTSRQAIGYARRALKSGHMLCAHPEEGRTHSIRNQNKQLFWNGERCIRELSPGVFYLGDENTWYVPTYVLMPNIQDLPPTQGPECIVEPYQRALGNRGEQYLPVEVFFGEPRQLPKGFHRKDKAALAAACVDLREWILHA